MEYFIGFLIGVVVGAAIALAVAYVRSRTAQRQMRDAFAAIAGEALDTNSRRLAEAAAAQLEGKKALIDQSVKAVSERLEQVGKLIHKVEAERKEDLGKLSGSVASLSATTGELHKMLASSQRRGAWGERMAEDVLRLAGLQEGVNYTKQSAADAEIGTPDFTFFLPNELKANMDVKFPMSAYKAYLDAENDDGRNAALKQLVADVRGHVRDIAGRGYIDPKAPTVPYVIMFIASEQIYALALAAEPDLLDEAMRKKVVLASPLTLYAMLAIVRQAAENANIMKTADEVITLLGQFYKQWMEYNIELDKLGQRIEQTARQFEYVRTTRSNQLQRPLDKIEDLRTARGLPDDTE
ncbi:MAG: DNA recombination protein RmuC [Planctomycetota bacterium]|jgi:DNA recombination protein RmuC